MAPTAQPPGLSGLGSPNQPLRQPRRFASRELQGATCVFGGPFSSPDFGPTDHPYSKRERERERKRDM